MRISGWFGNMKPKLVFFASIVLVAIVMMMAWHKDPAFNSVPSPGMTIYFAVFGFVMASLLIFTINAIVAVSRGRKAKDEEELEAMVAPALQGRQYDERIMRHTEIPRAIICGACLGALCAVTVHHFIK